MDWKMCLFFLQIVIIITNLGGFVLLKYNDFKHLSKSFEELKSKIDQYIKKQLRMDKQIVAINVRCEERKARKPIKKKQKGKEDPRKINQRRIKK